MHTMRLTDANVFTERPGPGEQAILPDVHLPTAGRARNLSIPATPDLFRPETRDERKTRLYAAAKRWAQRLPAESGEDHAKTYRLMLGNLLGALRS